MADSGTWSGAIAATLVFYNEIKRLSRSGTKDFTDGIVTALNGKTATVKLTNGTEVKAKTGLYVVNVSAWVLILKHYRQIGYKQHSPNYEVSSYEIVGVRYITEEGRITKIYRA